MASSVKTKLVRMGNSQGIRISKPIIEQLQLGPEVQIEVHADCLVVRRSSHPRAEWESTLAQQAQQEPELLIGDDVPLTEWEDVEWQW